MTLDRTEIEAGKYVNLILDARRLLMGFRSCDISHVRRECNIVAHTLVKFYVSSKQTKVWFESYPTCLLKLVNFELFSLAS
jgi:hypothetical protein